MSGYKKNNSNDRDALFGGSAALTGGAKKQSSTTKPASSRPAATKGYTPNGATNKSTIPTMSADARAAKKKEAEDYREKANACMKSTFFKKPDPVAACTYFKRTADCYQQLGEARLERLYRVESGECNVLCGAWASAASDFTRAAHLVAGAAGDDIPDPDQRRRDAAGLHKKAAAAWTQMNEKSKAAGSIVAAAVALHHGVVASRLSKEAITGMEEAVEAHVPDPLNPYARYRQTGNSAFIDHDTDETVEGVSQETLELARSHLVTRSYSHEPLQELVQLLTSFGEYASALYAAGAVSTVLKSDGLSTLSLSRAYVVETILTLAMGDPVAAEQQFLNRHCQDTFYLKARECQLAEELYRAVKLRDADALDAARAVTGPNRAALANLPSDALRDTVQELRVTGVARRAAPGNAVAAAQPRSKKAAGGTFAEAAPAAVAKSETPLQDLLRQKTGYEGAAAAALDPEALSAELDGLDFTGGGLDSDSDDIGGGGDDLDALEDDDIDLR